MPELFPTPTLFVWRCDKCGEKGECYEESPLECPKCGNKVFPSSTFKGGPEHGKHPYRRD